MKVVNAETGVFRHSATTLGYSSRLCIFSDENWRPILLGCALKSAFPSWSGDL